MRYFIVFWLFGISAVPLFFVLLALEHWAWAIFALVCIALARTDTVRIMVRSGSVGWAPYACESEMLLTKYTRPPTVVGRAWGYFIMRASANRPVLYMYNFTGRRKDGSWGAGTTIRTVANDYLKQGLTFPSHPSYDDITIGSWFAAGCHGSGGDAGSPSSSVFKCAEVVCFDPPSVEKIDNYETLRALFDRHAHHCVITWVTFHRLWPNRQVQKSAFDVDTLDSCARWLSDGAILRVLFVGAARDALGIRWQDVYDETVEHVDPHCCSRCCTFLQADVCSACCGCREPYTKWNGMTTLREANKWTPDIWPIETWIAAVGGYKNFEIIFRVSEMTPGRLLAMVQSLRAMHIKTGGRTEIRFGTAVVFWDVSMQHSFERPFELLQGFGVTRVALHASKFKPRVYVIPMVSVGDIYFNKDSSIRF